MSFLRDDQKYMAQVATVVDPFPTSSLKIALIELLEAIEQGLLCKTHPSVHEKY